MDEQIFKKECKRLAVRIASGADRSLVGSGVILVCEQEQYALIFTAAHVIESLNKKPTEVHFCFSDSDDKQQELVLTIENGSKINSSLKANAARYFIHPDYEKRTKGYPKHDAAIIQIPYYEWMKNLSKFQLADPKDEQAFLVGFPEKYDTKFDINEEFIETGYRQNIYAEMIKIEDSNYNNYVIKNVDPARNPFYEIDYEINGLSGGGIFSNDANGLILSSIFVSTKNEGSDVYYATCANSFINLMHKYALRSSINDLEYIAEKSYKRFNPVVDEEALVWYRNKTDIFLKKEGLNLFGGRFVQAGLLNCNSYRPLCSAFFISKLIGAVLIGTVYNIYEEDVNKQTVKINDYAEPVNIEYICSESRIEKIVADFLTGKAFSEQGVFKNQSIFIIGSKKDINDAVSRGRCRRIIDSIVIERSNEISASEEFLASVNGLLSEKNRNKKYVPFSVLRGDLTQADIAFVGQGRLEEVMKETQCLKENLESSVKGLIEKAWEA